MRLKFLTSIVCLLAVLNVSCGSKDDPVKPGPEPEPEPQPVEIKVNLSLQINNEMKDLTRAGGNESDATRWKVEIYKGELGEGTPVYSKVVNGKMDAKGKHNLKLSTTLEDEVYNVVAWMDYSNQNSVADKYYYINDLSKIKVLEAGKYVGNTDFKDAYLGSMKLDLTPIKKDNDKTVEASLTLERPLAKIELVTTDAKKFLSQNEAAKNNSLKVRFEYSGYIPTGINAFSGDLNASEVGMYFNSKLNLTDASEFTLATDYILVKPSGSEAEINLIISDINDNVLKTVNGIKVPVKRGYRTVVKDEFLTKSLAPGIEIKPDFDGNIDVEIPD